MRKVQGVRAIPSYWRRGTWRQRVRARRVRDRGFLRKRWNEALDAPSTGRNWLAVALIAVGGAIVIAGELLGVLDPRSDDTISEGVWWLRGITRGISSIAVLGFLAWLAYHFVI